MLNVTTASPAERPHPCIIGLTGGIGSGKSTVAELFARHGIDIVDADRIAHALTAPGGRAMPAIVAHFGSAMQSADGALDRAAMRRLIFTEPARKAELEDILHPLIRQQCLEELSRCRSPYALLVVPLLVETGHYLPLCRRILVIDCAPEIQLQRIMTRSRLSREEASRIIASQASRSTRNSFADDLLDNSDAPEQLPALVSKLHQNYLQLAAKQNQIS